MDPQDEVEAKEEAVLRKSVRRRHFRKELVQGTSALVTILGGGVGAYLLRNSPGLSLVAGTVILQRMQYDLPFLLSKLLPRGWFVSEKNEYQQLLFRLEEDYEVKKRYLSEYNEQVIINAISETQSYIDSFTPGYTYLSNLIENGFKRLGGILSLPVKKVRVKDKSLIFSSINEHLATFDVSVQKEISKLIFRMVTQSQSGYDGTPAKASYLFLGEAGTGKTTTAEAFARANGMPYCRINLGSMKLSDLFGSVDQNEVVIGRLAKCMIDPDIGKPGTNPLIFIDEIHDMLNSSHPDSNQLYTFLKILSDPDQGEIEDIGLGAIINISQATFIFGANARPDKQRDFSNALDSRLITIDFPALTQDQKRVAAYRFFSPLCSKYDYSPSPEDEKVVEEILSQDREPGARVLKKVLEDYVLQRAAASQGRIMANGFDVLESIQRNGGHSA